MSTNHGGQCTNHGGMDHTTSYSSCHSCMDTSDADLPALLQQKWETHVCTPNITESVVVIRDGGRIGGDCVDEDLAAMILEYSWVKI